MIERPAVVLTEHLEYLDELRDSGETNMFGSLPYVMEEFTTLSKAEAQKVITYWMKSYTELHN